MLTAIIAVTLSAPDLEATERAYTQQLQYRVVERGAVSGDLAAAWGAPRVAGRRYVLLQPQSNEPTYLRIVQSPASVGFAAMKTQGWNANEILIQDVDALAAKLRDSPFKIIGEPRPLSSGSKVRAMQVIGPAGELNYLTCIPPEGGSFIKTPARTFVDRSFIAVVGGTSMDALRAFYQDKLGLTVTATYSSAIDVLQHAWGLTPDTQTRMALAQISPGFLVELDEYPAAAPLRSQRDGDLPPGMAMVSFTVGSLNALKLPWRVKPVAHQQAPYNGRRAAMLLGPAGEWIELVEAK